jgi:hypothetical protein
MPTWTRIASPKRTYISSINTDLLRRMKWPFDPLPLPLLKNGEINEGGEIPSGFLFMCYTSHWVGFSYWIYSQYNTRYYRLQKSSAKYAGISLAVPCRQRPESDRQILQVSCDTKFKPRHCQQTNSASLLLKSIFQESQFLIILLHLFFLFVSFLLIFYYTDQRTCSLCGPSLSRFLFLNEAYPTRKPCGPSPRVLRQSLCSSAMP